MLISIRRDVILVRTIHTDTENLSVKNINYEKKAPKEPHFPDLLFSPSVTLQKLFQDLVPAVRTQLLGVRAEPRLGGLPCRAAQSTQRGSCSAVLCS